MTLGGIADKENDIAAHTKYSQEHDFQSYRHYFTFTWKTIPTLYGWRVHLEEGKSEVCVEVNKCPSWFWSTRQVTHHRLVLIRVIRDGGLCRIPAIFKRLENTRASKTRHVFHVASLQGQVSHVEN